MKNKKTSGSLFSLLVRNYLLFTVTLLVIAGGIFLLWNWWLMQPYQESDWDSLLSDPALKAGEYDALTKYLHSGDALAVYDASGTLVFASAEDFDPAYTEEELSCIPLRGDAVVTDVFEASGEKGQRLLIRYTYGADGVSAVSGIVALDETGQVVYGGFGDERQWYSDLEYQLLSGTRFPGNMLSRFLCTDAEGEALTVLLRETILKDSDYFRHYRTSWWIWLLFIPLYLAGAGMFIWWMRRRIGRPLQRLNDAVASQTEGRIARVGDCGGPREIRRIGESFDRFSERLAESERQRRLLDEGRQKLIADISHDLKTPVTVIAGYIDAICDGKVPPQEQERYLRAIQGKAQTLTELVNAFHEYSKVEHPAFVLHPLRTDLCEFLREYLAGKYDEIDLSGFTLEVSIPERPIFCSLDAMELRRALDNLITNALRHNRLGTALYVQVERNRDRAMIRVADNGAGIPPERAARIFEPFVVGNDARSGKGSGLGLSITRRIVEKHGGTIVLSDRPVLGRGTEFLLWLPLDAEHNET